LLNASIKEAVKRAKRNIHLKKREEEKFSKIELKTRPYIFSADSSSPMLIKNFSETATQYNLTKKQRQRIMFL
jgi:hypothetical protein